MAVVTNWIREAMDPGKMPYLWFVISKYVPLRNKNLHSQVRHFDEENSQRHRAQ